MIKLLASFLFAIASLGHAAITPTATPTRTVSPSLTPTRTNSPSPTITLTATRTASPTATRTITLTATITLTPTQTATPTPSSTISPSPTITVSPTRTRTPNALASVYAAYDGVRVSITTVDGLTLVGGADVNIDYIRVDRYVIPFTAIAKINVAPVTQ